MTPEEKALHDELAKLKTELETSLTTKASNEAKEQKALIEKQIKDIEQKLLDAEKARTDKLTPEIKALNEKVKTLEDGKVISDEIAKKNQQVIDDFVAAKKKRNESKDKKTFGEAMHVALAEAFESKQKEFESFKKDRDAKISIELKTVGDMTIPVNLTGDGVASYGPRQGLVPNQKVNIRDLIPATQSPTGLYVTYRETGGEGSISTQTEGAAKSQKDYDLSEVKTVSNYIAGFTRFSKQMMYVLPWLQTSLVRMLLRDFYKEENRKFYAAIALAASGFNTTASTEDNEAIIDLIYGRADTDFNTSFILGKNNMVGRMLKLMYGKGYYAGAGSIVGTPDGRVSISGIPAIGASFATSDKAMFIDTDYIERVETDSLKVEFSYEDADNFTKNLVTARVECFEDLNLLRTDAHSFLDLGNS
jgi:hypothetical protein